MKAEAKKVFVCDQCGKESLKWLGRCPNCQAWNSFKEQSVFTASRLSYRTSSCAPQELSQVDFESTDRFTLKLGEFDRVLGGGIVCGSMVLLGGEPGIGKSTLLLQISAMVANGKNPVVYISGEETARQIKLRAKRLGIGGARLYLLSETNVEVMLEELEKLSPGLVVIDSVQTIFLPELDTAPGSINQVRECTMRLMHWAKSSAVPVFLAGHVTKDGAIAGPRLLEHIVDVVLYLEGEQFNAYRLLRCVKNRFGSTNEIGVFEMKEQGLVEVDNPSRIFLSSRSDGTVGSAIVATLEGSRPLMVEIQALSNPTSFGLPRRIANGIDFGRLLMIIAVLSRRAGLRLGNQDIITNVTGGLRISEPAADLGVALAIASSFRDEAIDSGLVAVGEVGLSGEIRAVPQIEKRLAEVARLGFKRCLVPKGNRMSTKGIETIPVARVKEAIELGLLKTNKE